MTAFRIGFIEIAILLILIVCALVFSGRLGRKGKLVIIGGVVLAVAIVFAAIAVLRTGVFEARERYTLSERVSLDERRRVADIQQSIIRQEAELHASVARQKAEAHRSFPEDARSVVAIEPPPAEPWKAPADLGFEADVHPSAAAAAESLVVQLLKTKDAAHPDVSFQRVQIWGSHEIGPEVLTRVLARVQREHPDWQVMPEAAEPSEPLARNDEQAAAIQMQLVSHTVTHRAPWDTRREQHGGILRVRLYWRDGSLDRSTQFVEKPWVENASEFVSTQPEMRWVIGYSAQDSTDVVQATRQAVDSVAVQILPTARARMAQMGSAGVDDRWLLARIQQELLQMTNVRDRFTQTLITPYGGQVVREAILVASPAAVQRAVSDGQVQLRWARNTWFATVASAAGMCLLICVVGLLLNSVTKGYYRGRIVVLAGLLLVAVLLAVIKLSGMVFIPRPVIVDVGPPVTAEYRQVE